MSPPHVATPPLGCDGTTVGALPATPMPHPTPVPHTTPMHRTAAHCANTRCTICKTSWRTVQPRCPCDRHVGMITRHWGNPHTGRCRQRPYIASHRCPICPITLQMVGFVTAISVYPCRGRPACLPYSPRYAQYAALHCRATHHRKTGQTHRFAPTLHHTIAQYAPPRCKWATTSYRCGMILPLRIRYLPLLTHGDEPAVPVGNV